MQMFMKNTSYRKQKKLFHLDLHFGSSSFASTNRMSFRLQLSVTTTAIPKHVKLENCKNGKLRHLIVKRVTSPLDCLAATFNSFHAYLWSSVRFFLCFNIFAWSMTTLHDPACIQARMVSLGQWPRYTIRLVFRPTGSASAASIQPG